MPRSSSTATDLDVRAYFINLDRSPERREAVVADAAAAGLALVRIPAVDGKAVPAAERAILDEEGFQLLHGKRSLPGEYGCYASHIHALEAFLASGDEVGLILEDDVKVPLDIQSIVAEIRKEDDWDVVKLTHHRLTGFRRRRQLSNGRALGRPVFGPTGSSAAYLVNRFGARQLRERLVPMQLPYDVALERGWALGVRLLHVYPDPIAINWKTASTLADPGVRYAQMRLKPWRRLSTLRFRTLELFRRLAAAVRP